MSKLLLIILSIVLVVAIILLASYFLKTKMVANSETGKSGHREESAVLNKGMLKNPTWTPSEAETATFEKAVFKKLESDKIFSQIKNKFDLYKCQYSGNTDEKGVRWINGNYFLGDFGNNWRTEPFLVNDGGEAFFQADYNTVTGEITIMVNGQA